MPRNFYFGKDADIVAGSDRFATVISSSTVALGLVPAQATAFSTLNGVLQDAYPIAVNPLTRTPVAIAAKDLAIGNMRAAAIPLAQQISRNLNVTDAQLISLGLLPRSSRTPRPLPTFLPVVEVTSVAGRLVNFRVHNPEEETRRGKPGGVVGVNIYSYVGVTPATDPRDFHYEGIITRMTGEILFPNSVANGATVWICASWVSDRGEIGTGSVPISTNVQGGPVSAAA